MIEDTMAKFAILLVFYLLARFIMTIASDQLDE